ncbi:MAG: Fe-S cluster assembly protein SufB, partial [Bdellovibrionaceae bacterium]|nr:Fe-S cluster assembly protein SufB [Pseudobdellovibrionaceae bacterium]
MSSLNKKQYQHGFLTKLDMESFAKGLSEKVIHKISAKKKEPQWMLNYRLTAFAHWKTLEEPHWGSNNYEKLDYQDVIYYAEPKNIAEKKKNYEDLDP